MNETQGDKAYSILKKKIINQELRQGTAIVASEITAELNMSRTPIREALRRLDSDGLLEIIPQKGTYIRVFTITDLIGLYEIAEGLEGMVAYLVAEKMQNKEIDPESINYLELKIEKMDNLGRESSYQLWSEADALFHKKLYSLSKNDFIMNTLIRIRTQLNITLLNVIPSYMDVKKSNEEHKALFEAIKSGEPEKARQINQNQHNRVRNSLLKHSGKK